MKRRLLGSAWSLYLVCFLGACSIPSTSPPGERPLSLATQARWIKEEIPSAGSNPFTLLTFRKANRPTNGVLWIYIEGDGHIWSGRYPTDDPTPIKAIGLELALKQPEGAVAYLARPCQFIGVPVNPLCKTSVWNDGRYSDGVVSALNQAIDVLKAKTGAQKIVLVGYSGGAALSMLISARRQDIVEIITVAGNLDIDAWTNYHQLRPLRGSLNPLNSITQVQTIPQIHFVGGRDRVVPASLTEDWAKRYPEAFYPKIIKLPENDHVCCWVEQWPDLWKQVPLK
jgi:hypothetical protein